MSEPSLVSRFAAVLLAMIVVLGLLHLAVRLREVQVEDAAAYGYASARQSVRRVQVAGERGRILDRRGNVLAGNRTSYSVVCHPASFQQRTWEATVDAIEAAISNAARTVGRPSPLSRKTVRRHVNQTLAMPLVVWRDVGGDELARFSERANEHPGFFVLETEERIYPQGSLAAHLVGMVGRDRGEATEGDEKYNFFSPELRGRAGLEHYYDSFLRGVSGERRLLVDARGFAIREWTVIEPIAGPDLHLTLDLEIQREAERQLAGTKGACVVLDPRNGDVLALADNQKMTVAVSDAQAFGGARPSVDYMAVSFLGGSKFRPTAPLVFDEPTCGFAFGASAFIYSTAENPLTIKSPVTLLGGQQKWGNGPLALGGPLKFGETSVDEQAEGNVTDCYLSVREGSVKPLTADAFNGYRFLFYSGTSIVLDWNATGDLRTYGLRATKRIVAGQNHISGNNDYVIPITFDTGDVTELDGLEETHGLVTVPTAEADHVRACIKAVKPFKGVRVTIVETTDAAAGTTTFSAHVEKTGVILIIR